MKLSEIAKRMKEMYERGEFDPEVYQDYNALMELDVTERGSARGHVSYEVEYECEESNDDFDDGSWT